MLPSPLGSETCSLAASRLWRQGKRDDLRRAQLELPSLQTQLGAVSDTSPQSLMPQQSSVLRMFARYWVLQPLSYSGLIGGSGGSRAEYFAFRPKAFPRRPVRP